MKRFITTLIAAAILTMGLAACSNPAGGIHPAPCPSPARPMSPPAAANNRKMAKSDSSDLTYSSDDLGIAFSSGNTARPFQNPDEPTGSLWGNGGCCFPLLHGRAEPPGIGCPHPNHRNHEPAVLGKNKSRRRPLGHRTDHLRGWAGSGYDHPQSNPFSESGAYDLFNQLPKELAAVSESFRFLTR